MVCHPIDGCDHIIIADGSSNLAAEHQYQRYHCRCWRDQHKVILHRLHDILVAIEADNLGHGSDHEDLALLAKGHGAWEGDHLVRHEFSMHTPTWHATVDEIHPVVYQGVCPQ